MVEPKKVWTFNLLKPEISDSLTTTEEGLSSDCWRFEDGSLCSVLKTDLIFYTKKLAVEACYKYHSKAIEHHQEELNRRKRLLNKFYSEELYG